MSRSFFSSFDILCTKAKNTLAYTLLLPAIQAVESDPCPILNALKQTHHICHSRLFPKDGYYFFPTLYPSDDKTTKLSQVGFSTPSIDSPDFPFTKNFFIQTILMQCVLSSYDAAIQYLGSNSITSYTLANKYKNFGFMELKEKGVITTDFSTARMKDVKEATSAKASSFEQKLISHIQKLDLKGFSDLFPHDQEKISAFQSDLFYNISQINAKKFSTFLGMYNQTGEFTQTKKEDGWNRAKTVFEQLSLDKDESENSNRVDQLYYSYKAEKAFGLSLANCILQNISFLKENGKSYPSGVNELRSVAMLGRFPNVFSRTLYLQYAFESLFNESPLENSYFDSLKRPQAVMQEFEPDSFSISRWNQTLEQFCIFFSNWVFPVYEWYFFLTLLETANHALQSKRKTLENNDQQPTTANLKKQMSWIQEQLAAYIDAHYDIIREPDIYFKKYEKNIIDVSKIITCSWDFNLDKLANLPDIAQILTYYKSVSPNTVLPFAPLTPSLYLGKQENDLIYKKFYSQFIWFILNSSDKNK